MAAAPEINDSHRTGKNLCSGRATHVRFGSIADIGSLAIIR
jgi:hypothetical protein